MAFEWLVACTSEQEEKKKEKMKKKEEMEEHCGRYNVINKDHGYNSFLRETNNPNKIKNELFLV